MSPAKDAEILTPSTCECDLFGNRILANDQVKIEVIRVGPSLI